ncbi:hypothetical protein N8J89_36055 [Crossiella sp. CA-258035]|uniref:hypothetical protein n=1 Tax=Crossiella sp. CA-258035 TaxID=2981138 RepID=UPI0024BC54D6|nr:hypothetical protein [Crossiella sp. CA-258035]WHT18469.1 hypothetical protein N8J89_36055 [Crossiella sp. CA-258035]
MNSSGDATFLIMNIERPSRGFKTMHLYEELSKVRIQEAQRVSAERRLACELASARRWRTLSRWAARRAERFSAS